ncbi:ATP-binding protein [bacterium]|nr:ATP-binding protein [Candidatus Omnitrophota bacterium]MBU2528739.1 ATP-binding protein [bacterium]MBU3929370.1 ATP-binding protein [bacterium]
MLKRNSYIDLWDDLSSDKSMVFLSGPRQVGKTTLTKEIASAFSNSVYFNWDFVKHKQMLIKNPAFFEHLNRKDESAPLVIFDEIHKYKRWKNYLKGIYDQFGQNYKFLVSGSGRLDIYQKGGDSLAGRYFQFHLFPFTVAELSKEKRKFGEFIKNPLSGFDINHSASTKKIWNRLFRNGGFPEPYLKNSLSFYNKWAMNYSARLIREDIRSLHNIKDIGNIELLFSLLPSRVGAPVSVNNLAGELQVNFGSIKKWLELFESFYLIFKIAPWTKKISRSILKEKKIYLFNYPEIEDESSRFENMAALELTRAMHYWNEAGWGRFTLHYIRNKEKKEVDFLIADKNKPVLLIETKLNETAPAKNIIDFQNVLNIPAVQLVNKDSVFKIVKNNQNNILIVTAHQWLSSLP